MDYVKGIYFFYNFIVINIVLCNVIIKFINEDSVCLWYLDEKYYYGGLVGG